MRLLPLVAATYFIVSGGPYGLEDIIGMAGFGRALLLLAAVPFLWSFPTALMVGELASAIPDPQKLKYTTKVNGGLRQETGTDDMIWSVRQIIAHLSRGTTLRKGTVIMTGTPSGVGLFMEPKGFLKDGDVVEITIDGIGSIINKMVYE